MVTSITPTSGPSQVWATSALVTQCPECADVVDAALLVQGIQAASEVLFVLSGRQFPGAVVKTDVRPTYQEYDFYCDRRASRYDPLNSDASSSPLSIVDLGDFPLVSIQAVRINGATLAASAYAIHDFARLVRIDGSGWPAQQDLTKKSTELNTFAIDYTSGVLPGTMGQLAAARLACELILAFTSSAVCKLPKRVQTVARQGMTAILLDPFVMLDEGKTGLYEVDLFLVTVNPGHLRQPPVVVTPDTWNPTVRTTWSNP